jgi:DNA transposition AAA+ family ATPase
VLGIYPADGSLSAVVSAYSAAGKLAGGKNITEKQPEKRCFRID